MADNTVLDSGSGGNTLRTLEDGSSIHWPVSVVAYATSVADPDVLQVVTSAAPLPVGGTLLQSIVDTIVDNLINVNIAGQSASVTVNMGEDNDVQGMAAHDTPISGNPVLIGVEARTSERTAVTNGDVVRLMADLVGRLVVEPFAPSDLSQKNQTTHTDTTNQEMFAAAGAGVRNYLTDVSISNSSSTYTEVLIKDGTTEIYRFPAPGTGGAVHRFARPIFTTANTALNISTSGAVSTVRVSGSGYTGR